MGKKTGKIPVRESIMPKAMDRMPVRSVGDKWAQGLSEKQMVKYAAKDSENMMRVTMTVMNKSVLKDAEGNELANPREMQDGVPYVISSQTTGDNIGWVMRKGAAGVGRIYNDHIDGYEQIQNDPDRPHVLEDVEFSSIDLDEYGLTDEDFGYDDMSEDAHSYRETDIIDDTQVDDADAEYGE